MTKLNLQFLLSAAAWILLTNITLADELLATAIEKQNTRLIEKLWSQKVDVNAAQPDGMTPLHWAVHHDDLSLAQKLIQAGATVQAKNEYGITPLSIACINGNAKIVANLLDHGADAKSQVRGGETCLMTAARTGNAEVVQLLLQHGADPSATSQQGQTALMWAAADGHTQVVEELLRAKADPNVSLPSGFNAFLFAIRAGRAEVVEVLLAAGADPNQTMEPTKSGDKAVRTGTSPLILAVENGHFELAMRLVKAGADPNDQRSGFTPLHNLTWVRKPNRGDGDDGDPAPRGSGSLDSLQFVRQLVASGADVNRKLERGTGGRGKVNRKGATPFLLASITADLPLLRLLIELGADPTITNCENTTPLLAAAGVGTLAPGEEAGTEPEAIECVEYLLTLSNDINAVDDNGETAMHGASYKSLPKMVHFLAAHGAKTEVWNKQNKLGWTPLSIAEGTRVGNFKPSAETMAAIREVLDAAGVAPAAGPKPKAIDIYEKPKPPK